MWDNKSVSVVLMTYAEKDSIRKVIEDFYDTGVVDEVLVVNNNAQAGTDAEVAATPARQVFESRQGYGFATRRGLEDAIGDLVVLAEPDGTFLAEDIFKLLIYSDQFDAVFGTRTHQQMIWSGANMGWLLRTGNIVVARFIRLLYHSASMTDVGCTYRLFSRRAIDEILPLLRIGGSQLGPELVVRTVLSGFRHVEVPVNYLSRVGESSVTGDLRKAMILGVQMVRLVISMRIASIASTATRRIRLRPEVAPTTSRHFTPSVVINLDSDPAYHESELDAVRE